MEKDIIDRWQMRKYYLKILSEKNQELFYFDKKTRLRPVTVSRPPIRLPAKSIRLPADLAGSLIGSLETVTKVSREFDSCRTHFLSLWKKKKEKRRKPHLRVKIGLLIVCGERKLNIKIMLRGSLTSDKNKWDRSCWKVPGAHTLLMSEGDERF